MNTHAPISLAALAGLLLLTGCRDSCCRPCCPAPVGAYPSGSTTPGAPGTPWVPAGAPAGAPGAPSAMTGGQRAFATPEEAVDALETALETNDDDALRALAGPDSEDVVLSGADASVRGERLRVAALAKNAVAFEDLDDGSKVPVLGATRFPLPIPLKKGPSGWAFDVVTARQELLARRIGANELRVIAMARDVLEAQNAYKARDWDGDGVMEYAQKFISTPGTHDGLWWPAKPGESADERSPLGAAVGAGVDVQAGDKTYAGYRWKMLKAGAGGTFVADGHMVKGFAALAVPVEFRSSGVMSFLVGHDGRLLEKSLGPNGAATFDSMTEYAPDASWTDVKDEDADDAPAK